MPKGNDTAEVAIALLLRLAGDTEGGGNQFR